MDPLLYLAAFAAPPIILGGSIVGGISYMRRRDQLIEEWRLKPFIIVFPEVVETRQVAAWLRAISGRQPGGFLASFRSAPSIVLEVWADSRGITHRMKVPKDQEKFVISQLQSKVPGAYITRDANPPKHRWKVIEELGESAPYRMLDMDKPAGFSETLLRTMQPLQEGETKLWQLVVSPARRERQHQENRPTYSDRMRFSQVLRANMADSAEIAERNRKIGDGPGFAGVLRIAANAPTKQQAEALQDDFWSALGSISSATNRFKRRLATDRELRQGIAYGRGSAALVPPLTASLTETTGLTGIPIDKPNVAGLPQGRTPDLPPTAAIASKGRTLAMSTYQGNERPLAMTPTDSCKHVHVVGPIGSGKTALLLNMITQDIDAGHGVISIETKMDLFTQTLDVIPKHRWKDVIVVDPSDAEHPVGWNPFAGGGLAVGELASLLTSMYGNTSIHAPQQLFHGMHALAEVPGASITDLPSLFGQLSDEEKEWRKGIVRRLKDPLIKKWWEDFLAKPEREQVTESQPLRNRIWQLTNRREISRILGQSTSTLNFKEALEQNKIVLIFLSSARLEMTTINILGALLVDDLWRAARLANVTKENYFYADEFQEITKSFNKTAEMIAQGRSFKLGLCLAHQNLSQLPRELRELVAANVRTKVAFQTEGDDARTLANMFSRGLDESYLRNLPAYHVLMKFATDQGVVGPVTGKTMPPPASRGSYDAVREMSRRLYGRPAHEVDAEMAARRKPKKKKTGTPEFGGTDF